MPDNPAAEKFSSWAIVELMGRQQLAGKVTEEVRFGTTMLRVDVPEVTKRSSHWQGGGPAITERTIPAYTRYFSASALYAVTPCSEDIARAAAKSYGAEPPVQLALPEKLLPTPTPADSDAGAMGPSSCNSEDYRYSEPGCS